MTVGGSHERITPLSTSTPSDPPTIQEELSPRTPSLQSTKDVTKEVGKLTLSSSSTSPSTSTSSSKSSLLGRASSPTLSSSDEKTESASSSSSSERSTPARLDEVATQTLSFSSTSSSSPSLVERTSERSTLARLDEVATQTLSPSSTSSSSPSLVGRTSTFEDTRYRSNTGIYHPPVQPKSNFRQRIETSNHPEIELCHNYSKLAETLQKSSLDPKTRASVEKDFAKCKSMMKEHLGRQGVYEAEGLTDQAAIADSLSSCISLEKDRLQAVEFKFFARREIVPNLLNKYRETTESSLKTIKQGSDEFKQLLTQLSGIYERYPQFKLSEEGFKNLRRNWTLLQATPLMKKNAMFKAEKNKLLLEDMPITTDAAQIKQEAGMLEKSYDIIKARHSDPLSSSSSTKLT